MQVTLPLPSTRRAHSAPPAVADSAPASGAVPGQRSPAARQQVRLYCTQWRHLPPAGHQARQADSDQVNTFIVHRGARRFFRLDWASQQGIHRALRSQSLFPRHTANKKATTRVASLFSGLQTEAYSPSAAIPACATCASSLDFTPDTPTAPSTWPSLTIITPPSSSPST